MSRIFLANPRFAEYARLLFRLHGLIATEMAESDQAEQVRSSMDQEWARLSAAERDELRKLSEQLYRFHAEPDADAA